MPLVSMKQLLKEADEKQYAVGAFSIINMETIIGAVRAAEAMNTPIILQIAEPRLKYASLPLIGSLMVKAAQGASVPIAVHFDHGENFSTIREAIDLGFTSVMIDASHLPFDQNVELTKKVATYAHSMGVDCEGEIGRLGLNEDNTKDFGVAYTQLKEAVLFAKLTEVDAMAIAIGNNHGLHKNPPKLDLERLSEINKGTSVPLVLHGGSGITDDDFRACIKQGIRKINVASSTLHYVLENVKKYIQGGGNNYFEYHNEVIQGAFLSVKYHIEVFNSLMEKEGII